jgi:hypothetical protein
VTEAAKAQELSTLLDVPVSENQVRSSSTCLHCLERDAGFGLCQSVRTSASLFYFGGSVPVFRHIFP